MKIKIILILFVAICFSEIANSTTYNLNQTTGTVSFTTGYTNLVNNTWCINTGVSKPVMINYNIDVEEEYDFVHFVAVDNNNIETPIASFTGAFSGSISSIIPSGKIKIIFTSDGSVCYPSYSGITINFSVDNGYSNIENSFTSGNSIIAGSLGIGVISPQSKLDVNGNALIGSTDNKLKLIEWNPGKGFWIDIPVVSGIPAGIGSGGQGANAWIAYTGLAGQWFTNSTAGDLCYRNANSKLLFGNSGSAVMAISGNKVGIGTTNPDALLTVNGSIHAKEVVVTVDIPADYVFKPSYKLMPLHEVEQYVNANSHLPEIPSASEITEKGLSVGEMQNKLLQKVEELTLYIIEQQKQINQLKQSLK